MKYIKEYYRESHWERYNNEKSLAGGMGEDNNMESYKQDILSTRFRFKKIAEAKGFKKPFKFKRQDFRWEKSTYHDSLRLMGKLVLTSKDGQILITGDMEWMYYEDPEYFKRLCDSLHNKKFYNNFYKKQQKRYEIIKQNLIRLGVIKS